MPIDFALSDGQRELPRGAREFAEQVLRPGPRTGVSGTPAER
ncbi:MAG: hypothetical protein ABSA02_23055 [Trebonia sp.]